MKPCEKLSCRGRESRASYRRFQLARVRIELAIRVCGLSRGGRCLPSMLPGTNGSRLNVMVRIISTMRPLAVGQKRKRLASIRQIVCDSQHCLARWRRHKFSVVAALSGGCPSGQRLDQVQTRGKLQLICGANPRLAGITDCRTIRLVKGLDIESARQSPRRS